MSTLPTVLVAFLASRLLLFAVVLVVEATLPLSYARPTYASTPLLGGLTGHDAIYYLGIAAEGYHRSPVSGSHPDWVFFPAFPLLTKVISIATFGNIAFAGVLASNLSLFVALILIGTLVAAEADVDTARLAVILTAFAPGAVAFGMAYSDSLLLAASAGAILAARRQRYLLTGALFVVAVLSRPPGILLGLPLLVALGQQGAPVPLRRWAALLAGPLALVGFAAYQGFVLGDPFAFIHGQAAWDIGPISGETANGVTAGGSGSTVPLVVLLVVVLLGYTATLPGLWKSRLPRPEVLVALVAFGSVFLSGRLQSDARYLAVGWPFGWYLATRGTSTKNVVLAISAALYVMFAFLNVTQVLAP